MLLVSFEKGQQFQASIFYNEHGMPEEVHPLLKMLSKTSKTEAVEYAKLRGWDYFVS